MGSAPSKSPKYEKLVYETPDDGAKFTSNEDDTELQFELPNQSFRSHWKKNCVFTEDPFYVTQGLALTLRIEGTGILRFGLTIEDPNGERDFVKSSVVTHEEGFEKEENTRIVSVDAFNFVTYKNTETNMKKDLAEIKNSTRAWLYLIVVQGRPKISIKKDQMKQNLRLKSFQGSNIKVTDDDAIPTKTSDSGVCRLANPVSLDQTYCISWEMKLRGNDEDNSCSSRKFGFFRFGFVTNEQQSLIQLSIYSDHMDSGSMWFVESAVSSFVYTDLITVTVNKTAQTITHNLRLSSANGAVTEKFPLDCTKPLYLVLEVFHGDICGIRKFAPSRAPKVMYPGTILLFKNFSADDKMPEHLLIGSIFRSEPCRIQYGTNPSSILVEFRKTFCKSEIMNVSKSRSLPWESMVEVWETSKIQALDVPDDVDANDLDAFFSNKSVCGGGKIRNTYPVDYIQGCWIIEYKHNSDARRVWQEGKHRLESDSVMVSVSVLPFYDQLGPTGNHGLKPQFDTTDLEILIENERKMRFLLTVEKKRFEEHMMRKLKLRVSWPSVQESEFEDETLSDGDDNTHNRILLRCEIPPDQYQQLVLWKENGRKCVDEFVSGIQIWSTVVEANVWENTVDVLKKETQTKLFDFYEDKLNRTIEIITSNHDLLSELKQTIQNIKPPEEQIVKCLDIEALKYKTLDELGFLVKLERSNPNTSSRLDLKNNKLILKGPASEVAKMNTGILELDINTEKVSVSISKEAEQVFKSEAGKGLLALSLKKENLTKMFEIRDAHCEIFIYLENPASREKAERKLKNCLRILLVEEKCSIPDQIIEVPRKVEELKAMLRKIEEMNKNAVVLSLEGKMIKCVGTTSVVNAAIEQIKQRLEGNTLEKGFAYFQRNIVNYFDAYKQKFDCDNCVFLKNKDGVLTGEICFHCKVGETELIKAAIQKKTEKISTFWFYLERPWLANVIASLDVLNSLAEEHHCLLQPEIADTLALAGVSMVALSHTGTAVQVIKCDLTAQDTDVVVNPTNSDLMMNRGLGKAISDAAGPDVQTECLRHIESHGNLSEGSAVFTNAGNLTCREILHVVGPVWKDGQSEERNILQTAVWKVLAMVTDRKYLSVMIPAISCGVLGFPNDKATEHIVQAIYNFVSNNPESTVKEIYLCDRRQELITHFENAIEKIIKSPWFVFKHNRPCKQAPVERSMDTEMPNNPVRPKSSRPGQRSDIFGKSMRWGKQENTRKHSFTESISSADSSLKDEEISFQRARYPILPAGLPMSVSLTDKTKLTIFTGTIESQEHDVIVCTTAQFPDLVGAVADALTGKGGDAIKKDCKQKGNLQFGDVICTDKGQLRCKKLFHVRTLMDWNDRAGPKNVREIVGPCLKQADSRGYQSLLFPAIGTGASHYPANEVAQLMTKTIVEYLENNTNTSLKEVSIVIYERDAVTAQTFENIVPKLLAPNDASATIRKKKKMKAPKTPACADVPKVKSLLVKYKEPSKPEDHSEADDVVLVQATTAGTTLNLIKRKAEELLDLEFPVKKIDFKKLTDENNLEDDEVKRLQQLNTTKVKIDIDQRASEVIISGLAVDVHRVENDASNLLRTEFPQRRKQKRTEQFVAELVQWQVADDGGQGRKNVSTEVNFVLETNFDRGVDFKYLNNGTEYQVLRSTLEEHPVNNHLMKRKLYRGIRANQGIFTPESWSISGTDDDYKEVEILSNDPIFDDVKKKFTAAGCKPNTINKVIRIENRTLYLQYAVMKKKTEIRNGRKIQNERELWHGTTSDTITLICQKGFNRRFAGKNATKYGEGVYFALRSEFSHNYASPDAQGTRRMILSSVLTGEYHLGQSNMTAPPIKSDQVLYDSLVDNVNNPTIFVIFHDTQAYPQYVIEYT